MESLLVSTAAAFHKLKCATALMIAKITRLQMKRTNDAQATRRVQPIILSVRKQTFASNLTGFAMATTIVETTLMKTQFIVLKELARKTHSDVQIIVAFQLLGIAVSFVASKCLKEVSIKFISVQMVTTIAAMEPMSLQNTASRKVEHVSVIFSHVTTAIAFHVFTFAMVITIAWTTPMKIIVINAVSFILLHCKTKFLITIIIH